MKTSLEFKARVALCSVGLGSWTITLWVVASNAFNPIVTVVALILGFVIAIRAIIAGTSSLEGLKNPETSRGKSRQAAQSSSRGGIRGVHSNA